MPAGNSMPGTETRMTGDAIAAHRPHDADAFARREPSRPAPMPAGAVLVPGTGPDMPVTLPAADSLAGPITRVAAITRQRKTPPYTSVTLPGPRFRLLASTGLLRRLANRQRLARSLATNLRGPAQPLTFAGAPLRAMIRIPNTTGNIPVTFAAQHSRRPRGPVRRLPGSLGQPTATP
jgi:hypothetical protein